MGLDVRDRFAAGRGYLGAATLGLPADVTVAGPAPRRGGVRDRHRRRDGVHRAGGAGPGYAALAGRRTCPRRGRLAGLGVHRSRGSRRSAGAEVVSSTVTSPPWSGRSWPAATCGCARCRSRTSPDPWARTPGWWRSRWCPRARASSRRRRGLGGRAGDGGRVLVDALQATGWLPTTEPRRRPRRLPHVQVAVRPAAARSPRSPSGRRRRSGPSRRGGTRRGPVGVVLRTDAGPGPRREPVRPLAHLARLGRRRGRAGFAVSLDPADVRDHAVGLANGFQGADRSRPFGQRDRVLARPRRRPPGGARRRWRRRLQAAGRARVSFHLWNNEEDRPGSARDRSLSRPITAR